MPSLKYACQWSPFLAVPPEVSSKKLIQTCIVRFEVLHQSFPGGGGHGGVARVVEWLVHALLLSYRNVQKLQGLLDDCRGISIEIFGLENQKLLSRENTHPLWELLDIFATGEIAVMAVIKAVILDILQYFLFLAREPLLFNFNCLFK